MILSKLNTTPLNYTVCYQCLNDNNLQIKSQEKYLYFLHSYITYFSNIVTLLLNPCMNTP